MTASQLPKLLPFRDGGVYTDPAGREVICTLLPNLPPYLTTRAALATPNDVTIVSCAGFQTVVRTGEAPIDPFTLRDTGETDEDETSAEVYGDAYDPEESKGEIVSVTYERGPEIEGLYKEDES